MAAAGTWRVRDFHDDDLDAAVRLWDSPASSGEAPAFGLSDLIAAVRSHEPAVVAVVGEEELIERRVILPLAQPQLAGRLGLVPPRAIVLFGPPGTGKTTFAKGAASRLGWPFVELFPSRLAGESPAGLAAALREAFALVAELEKVVVFIDEVEEIAGTRQPRTASAAQGVTNEMLKLIPPFREQDERLLICATNSVRALDIQSCARV